MKNYVLPGLAVAGLLSLAACANNSAPADAQPMDTGTVASAAPSANAPASTAAAAATSAPADTATHDGHSSANATPAAAAGGEHTAMGHAPGSADHAPMDKATAAGTVQAGWYRAGNFQPCGSARGLKIGSAGAIDAKIKAEGMSASDPVYVRLEGTSAGDAMTVTRVAQVGSPTPVRDCPMTGTATQVGG